MSNNQQIFKTFNFKYVKTGETPPTTLDIEINVDIEATMSEFINNTSRCLRPFVRTDNFYIIEAGQFNNINGRDAELAPPLEPSDIKMKDYFNKRLNTTAFYVRDFNN